jgi:trigger factor
MDAQLEQLDDQRVRLTVPVPAGEVKHAVTHAAHDLAERVKIPGFRAGKVPPEVLLSRIGKERLYSEAVESHISNWFWSAARGSRLRPARTPDFSYELPASDEQDWEFTAEFPVQGPVAPADWHELEVPRLAVEVDEEFVTAGLEALQGTVAALSSVEGRPARAGDVAVVDIVSDAGSAQRDYVVELGGDRLLDEIEAGVRDLQPGESQQVSWDLPEGAKRYATVTLKELFEKVLPPLDDDLARAASEFETLAALRADVEERIRTLLEGEAESRFRSDAVDELVKASKVEPAELVVEVRTRELLNAFLRQLEARGIDPAAYLQMAGISGAELERTLWAEATHSIGRELVLEGAADRLGLEVTDEDIRAELRDGGESDEEIDEFLASSLADRARHDLRLRQAVDRIAAEVKPISQELAQARERLWTPDKEAASAPEKKLWTPGSSKDEGVVR